MTSTEEPSLVFEEREKEWLALELYARPAPPTSRPERPATPWADSSERTKRRKYPGILKSTCYIFGC